MFCSLALAVPDTVFWRFEIAFMATLFEIEGNLKYELVDKIADGRMRGCFGPTRSRSVMMSFEGDVKLSDFGVAKAAGLIDQNEGEQLSGTRYGPTNEILARYMRELLPDKVPA
jgi:hypothetical protein